MRISLIAAVAANRVIGRGLDLPWHLPDDLRRFKRITVGHTVIMGRRTWDSVGRPLPRRRNLVLSRNPDFRPEGAEVFPGLEAALASCRDEEEVFVLGGGQIYAYAIARADRLYLTELDAEVEGDVVFPEIDPREWEVVEETPHPADERHAFSFTFRTYSRRAGDPR